jgi:branched-chain amino acid transport system substrate-binding protein
MTAGIAASAWAGDDGVSANKVLIGQACALKGPAMALGTGMQSGLNVYFKKVNGSGGINSRTIELKTVNDGYEPDKCAAAVKTLIEGDKVFLVIGGVGTPTAKVAVPVCDAAKVPFVAPFTGAELLRTPANKNVVNFRASYFQEMEAHAARLIDKQGVKKVACLYQNDPYGQAGLDGINKAMEKRGMKLVATATYERNTVAVADALNTIAASAPDAIVMVGAYKPCAQFIKLAKANPATKNATFCNISFVGTDALLQELGSDGEGVVVSQVVPYPWDTTVPVVAEYQADMKAAGAEADIGFVSLEGYLSGKFFCEALKKVTGEPTRENFLATIYSTKTFDLGGVKLTFGDNDNQGSDAVFMTVFKGGKCVPVTDSATAGVNTDK